MLHKDARLDWQLREGKRSWQINGYFSAADRVHAAALIPIAGQRVLACGQLRREYAELIEQYHDDPFTLWCELLEQVNGSTDHLSGVERTKDGREVPFASGRILLLAEACAALCMHLAAQEWRPQ